MGRRKKINYFLLFLSVALYFLAYGWDNISFTEPDFQAQVNQFSIDLEKKESLVQEEMELMHRNFRDIGIATTLRRNIDHYTGLFEKNGIVIQIFREDSFLYWTHNLLPIEETESLPKENSGWLETSTGWFRVIHWQKDEFDFIGLIVVKREYPYENKYLKSGFHPDFNLPADAILTTTQISGSLPFQPKGVPDPVFITFPDKQGPSLLRISGVFILNLCAGALFLLCISRISIALVRKNKPGVALFLLLFFVVAGRWALLEFASYQVFNNYLLFNPSLYATSTIFPTLGDFLINGLLLVYLSLMISLQVFPVLLKKKKFNLPAILFFFLLIIGFGFWINLLTKGLVENSNISFDVNNLLGVDFYTLIGLITLALLYLSFAVTADMLVKSAKKAGVNFNKFLLIILISGGIAALIATGVGLKNLFYTAWPFITIIVTTFSLWKNKKLVNPGGAVGLLFLFSIVAAYSLADFSKTKEFKERMIIAEKLSVDDDPVTEWLYLDLEKQLLEDKYLQSLFPGSGGLTSTELRQLIQPRFFTGYWGRYNITLHAFNKDSTRWGKLTSTRPPSFREITTKLDQVGTRTIVSPNLYHIYSPETQLSYIISLPYNPEGDTLGYLVFELSANILPDKIGFPELLIDKRARLPESIAGYSTAKYVNGRLVNHIGPYSYRTTDKIYRRRDEPVHRFNYNGFDHLLYKSDESTTVVVSKKNLTFLDYATSFSYLIAFFGVIYLALFLVYSRLFIKAYPWLNLTGKIQILLGGFFLTTLALFGLTSRQYIEQQYLEKNIRNISEKSQSVLLELKNNLVEEESLNESHSDYLNQLLTSLSYIFFSDINLYDNRGNLLATSQPRIYTEELISRKMNARAYVKMRVNEKNEFIHEEQVAGLNYLSAYLPFFNQNGNLLGYLNLPYFAKQTELDEEVAQFYITLINIFVLLFIVSLLASLFVSNWITHPLSRIRKALAEIEIGKTNRMIHYRGNDEIARLVAEYNAKIAELELNADRLAKSERESAWREMAKQVAHEIKNPLTPMKLSVQLLERALDDQSPDYPQRMKRVTKTLVEQIDSLTTIANAFSNFAKMPQARNEKLNLKELINNIVLLYEDTPGITISIEDAVEDQAFIFADKDQMMRVFNNLIKNAIQAIPEEKNGLITISLIRKEEDFIVSVKDNGRGIPSELKPKIFEPNFTTKTRGMGMGLALVHKMVENAGGEIWFESTTSGTEFLIRLEVLREE